VCALECTSRRHCDSTSQRYCSQLSSSNTCCLKPLFRAAALTAAASFCFCSHALLLLLTALTLSSFEGSSLSSASTVFTLARMSVCHMCSSNIRAVAAQQTSV
jgi:hypothetical protein